MRLQPIIALENRATAFPKALINLLRALLTTSSRASTRRLAALLCLFWLLGRLDHNFKKFITD